MFVFYYFMDRLCIFMYTTAFLHIDAGLVCIYLVFIFSRFKTKKGFFELTYLLHC